MDPLSITASAITVATLAATACNAFAELRSLCKSLPGRLHALSNEVVDLEVVVCHVASVSKERSDSPGDQCQQAVFRHLEQAESKLNEIQIVVGQLSVLCKRSNTFPFQAYWWKKERPKLRELQEEVHTIKTNLNVALGASNSRDLLRVRLDLENLSLITSEATSETVGKRDEFKSDVLQTLAAQHMGMEMSLHRVYENVDRRIAQVEGMLQGQADCTQQTLGTQFGPVVRVRPPNRRRPSPPQLPARSEGVQVRLNRFTSGCHAGCKCACHISRKATTPGFMDRIIGQLFLSYTSLPLLNNKCDSQECAKKEMATCSVEYWFPLGICWSQILRLQLGYQASVGPQLSLSTLRRVPDSAPCVTFALRGDIDGLKDLFSRGLASPRDVSTTRGYSILRWALYGKQYDTCKFLVHAGADPGYRPISKYDNNPRNKAWDFILQGGLSREVLETLSCLTEGSDFIEEQNYTQMHNIVLGRSMKSLEEEIARAPGDMDAIDLLGRTPLIWAAARGNKQDVTLLLGAGSDPNAMDTQYTTAVSYAAERDHVVCVRLLLEAGAEPDPILPEGIKVGSPLNCAARNAKNPAVLKTLLDFGADIEASGVEGVTPLIHVTRSNKTEFAMLLLEYGANLNATTALEETPLSTAISYNSHHILRLLLNRWFEFTTCPRLKSPHLLEVTAMYADLETINILTGVDHISLNFDCSYAVGEFAARLRQRSNADEKHVTAFNHLISVITQEGKVSTGGEKSTESGLNSCPHADARPTLDESFEDALMEILE